MYKWFLYLVTTHKPFIKAALAESHTEKDNKKPLISFDQGGRDQHCVCFISNKKQILA